MPEHLIAFFNAYRDAFNALNGDAIASMYAVPSGIAQGGVFTLWAEPGPIQNNMRDLCDLYRQRGYQEATYELASYIAQGHEYAVVDLRWRIEWAAGEAPWYFNTTYNLVKTAQGWKVLVCSAYSEDRLHKARPSEA